MFCVLKRIVSLRLFFCVPTTNVLVRNKKNNFQLLTLIWGPGYRFLVYANLINVVDFVTPACNRRFFFTYLLYHMMSHLGVL